MRNNTRKHSTKAGMPPGSLVYTGNKKNEASHITLLTYSEETVVVEKEVTMDELSSLSLNVPNTGLHWISVVGVHDVQAVEQLGKCFDLHPLVLEDILNTGQRPKIEIYDGYTHLVAKKISYDNILGEFIMEQESFILGPNYVISFSEHNGDAYDPLRKRIKEGAGRIRKMGIDYLMFALLDIIVDHYFIALEDLEDQIELAEDQLVSNPSPETLKIIHKLKTQMIYLHKSVWPLREVIGTLSRSETVLISEATEIYMRDLYDHIIQVMDTTETLRDILSSMLDMYLSSVSNRMNEIMKVLTIISTVFIPLSFIVGLYGMNLKNMPEYDWPWMYPVLWVIMISIVASMLYFFKKKKWW